MTRLILAAIGAAHVVAGVALIYTPAGIIVAGVLLVVLAWLLGDDTPT